VPKVIPLQELQRIWLELPVPYIEALAGTVPIAVVIVHRPGGIYAAPPPFDDTESAEFIAT